MKLGRTPFIIVPVWVKQSITPTTMCVYLALCERSLIERKPPKGMRWVQDASGLGRTAVYDAIAALKDIGALAEDGDEWFLPVDDPSATADSVSATPDDSSAHTDDASLLENEDSLSGAIAPGYGANGLPLTADQLEPNTYPREFELTWLAYPQQRRTAKREAYKRWRATIIRESKATPPLEVMRQLYRATKHYAKAMAIKVDAGGSWDYVKLPETFFGGKDAWKDYITSARVEPERKEWET